jgi:branched-subunit amino acid transport protein AzlD
MNLLEKTTFAVTLILSTQSTRLIPLVFKNQLLKFLNKDLIKNHLGDLIIFFLILYCYRDANLSLEYGLRLAIGCLVFGLQWWKENSLLSIFSGTALYMIVRAVL